jgi:hypothetical protein
MAHSLASFARNFGSVKSGFLITDIIKLILIFIFNLNYSGPEIPYGSLRNELTLILQQLMVKQKYEL